MTGKVKCKRCGKPMEFYREDNGILDFICRDCEVLFRVNKKYIGEVMKNDRD